MLKLYLIGSSRCALEFSACHKNLIPSVGAFARHNCKPKFQQTPKKRPGLYV